MYTAFNNRVVCKVKSDTNLSNQVLSGTVVATTEITKELEGKTILAERRHFIVLSDTGEEAATKSGIILGDRMNYAAISVEDIVAVKDEVE